MTETFKACFEKLELLSTEDLDRSVAELLLVENRNVALVIAHLAELSRRKGELKLGYPNLFAYCVGKLGLSEGSVALRIQVAITPCGRSKRTERSTSSAGSRRESSNWPAPRATARPR